MKKKRYFRRYFVGWFLVPFLIIITSGVGYILNPYRCLTHEVALLDFAAKPPPIIKLSLINPATGGDEVLVLWQVKLPPDDVGYVRLRACRESRFRIQARFQVLKNRSLMNSEESAPDLPTTQL